MASKILTIKKIFQDNMNKSYPLINIISDYENITLNNTYEYYLNHSTKNNCGA